MTAASPSTIHIGHYMSCAESEDLSELIALFISLPFAHGFSHPRWNASVHHMLEKSAGTPDIECLWIIQLIEEDLNMYLKIKVNRQLLDHTSKHNLLPPEMHGGREGKSTHAPLLSQTLLFDISRQTKRGLICMNLDAESCYDRIVPNYGTITLTRLGLPQSIGIALEKNQRQMKHQVKTQHGISSDHIQQQSHEIWGGIGQGSAAAGPMWLAIEAPMISSFNSMYKEMNIKSPNKSITYNTQIAGFIDDNNTNVSIPTHSTSRTLQTKVQTIITTWNEVLALSGGALSATKCFYYILQWKWNAGKATLMPPSTQHVTITYTIYPCKLKVKEIDSSCGKHYLGIRLSPDGSMKEEFSFRHNEAKKYGMCLQGAHLSPYEATIMHTMIWLPKMRYFLAFTTFSKSQCQAIEAAYMPHLLTKIGYNRHMPRDVVYGSLSLGGIGLTSLFQLQDTLQINNMLYDLRSKTNVSKLILISLAHLQIEYGFEHKVLSFPLITSDHLTNTYSKQLWVFLTENNTTMNIP